MDSITSDMLRNTWIAIECRLDTLKLKLCAIRAHIEEDTQGLYESCDFITTKFFDTSFFFLIENL